MTPQMKAALDFIRAYMEEHDGISPSYEEIGLWLGFASRGGVHRLLTLMKQRGLIDFLPRARSIRLINEPPRASQIAAWTTDELIRVASTIGEVLAKRRAQAIFQGGDA